MLSCELFLFFVSVCSFIYRTVVTNIEICSKLFSCKMSGGGDLYEGNDKLFKMK